MYIQLTHSDYRNRYRWELRDDEGKVIALCPINGYDQEYLALGAAETIFPNFPIYTTTGVRVS